MRVLEGNPERNKMSRTSLFTLLRIPYITPTSTIDLNMSLLSACGNLGHSSVSVSPQKELSLSECLRSSHTSFSHVLGHLRAATQILRHTHAPRKFRIKNLVAKTSRHVQGPFMEIRTLTPRLTPDWLHTTFPHKTQEAYMIPSRVSHKTS